jgi:hypothetical protein
MTTATSTIDEVVLKRAKAKVTRRQKLYNLLDNAWRERYKREGKDSQGLVTFLVEKVFVASDMLEEAKRHLNDLEWEFYGGRKLNVIKEAGNFSDDEIPF